MRMTGVMTLTTREVQTSIEGLSVFASSLFKKLALNFVSFSFLVSAREGGTRGRARLLVLRRWRKTYTRRVSTFPFLLSNLRNLQLSYCPRFRGHLFSWGRAATAVLTQTSSWSPGLVPGRRSANFADYLLGKPTCVLNPQHRQG